MSRGMITFVDYLMSKSALQKNSNYTIQHIASREDQGFPNFPKVISLKVKAQLKFELTCYDATAQYVSHYATGTPQAKKEKSTKVY